MSSSRDAAASTTRRLARTASGPAAAICRPEPERFVAGGAGVDEPAHQSEVEGAARLDRLAGEDRVHRRGRADGAGEPEQPAGTGDEVAGHLREPERRSGRRHDDVGGEDDLEPARGREAVDGDDHGLRAFAVDEPGEPTTLGRERRGVSLLGDHLQVGTGAEDGAFLAGGVRAEHADPHVGVVLQLVDGRLEPERDVAVDRVASFRTVEGDDADPVGGRVQHRVGHGMLPSDVERHRTLEAHSIE